MTKYERNVICPILMAIEQHQDFLCKPENLPQLAKLGFMFEKLWYAGRVCYGSEGIVKKMSYTCENNPKYEISDRLKYNSEENENLVYDAWGMHVSNDGNQMNFEEFSNLILNGKPLSEFEIQERKPKKTFEEWVAVMTDKRYRYHSMFPDRRRVADYLLCTIGTGYGYDTKNGVIIKEASGADQDQDAYGSWENAKFIPEIQAVVDVVLAFDMTKIAMDAESAYIKKLVAKRKDEEFEQQRILHEALLPAVNEKLVAKGEEPVTIDSERYREIYEKYLELRMEEIMGGRKNKKETYEYYPICSYSIITQLNENAHPSYIKAGLEICEDIQKNPPPIKKDWNDYQKQQRNEMIEFAKNFIKKWKEPKSLPIQDKGIESMRNHKPLFS